MIKIPDFLAILQVGVTVEIAGLFIWVASSRDNIIKLKRDFEIQILETGYRFIGQNKPGDSVQYIYSDQHPNS